MISPHAQNREKQQLIMTDLLSIQTALCLIFILVVSNQQLPGKVNVYNYQLLICLTLFAAFANNSCQVYPSEYAYQMNSVIESEISSAMCRPYAKGLDDQERATQNYIHCDGTQLRLTDSDLGTEQCSSSDCYVWNAGSSNHQLLFIFPKKVNLTTITLHYYSDGLKGLSRLRFYAVPDDFDIWDALTASYSRVDIAAVPPNGELAGRRNVSVNVDFMNVKKVLL